MKYGGRNYPQRRGLGEVDREGNVPAMRTLEGDHAAHRQPENAPLFPPAPTRLPTSVRPSRKSDTFAPAGRGSCQIHTATLSTGHRLKDACVHVGHALRETDAGSRRFLSPCTELSSLLAMANRHLIIFTPHNRRLFNRWFTKNPSLLHPFYAIFRFSGNCWRNRMLLKPALRQSSMLRSKYQAAFSWLGRFPDRLTTNSGSPVLASERTRG